MNSSEIAGAKDLEALPKRVAWALAAATRIDFHAPTAPLSRVVGREILAQSALEPVRWEALFPFGEFFAEGGAAWSFCIDAANGSISSVELELDEPERMVNHSAAQFVRSFAVVDATVTGKMECADAAKTLRGIDEKAYDLPNEWRELVEFVGQSRVSDEPSRSTLAGRKRSQFVRFVQDAMREALESVKIRGK